MSPQALREAATPPQRVRAGPAWAVGSAIALGLSGLVACEGRVAAYADDAELAAECVVDDDCTLMPSRMTCCGECDPAPPFDAVPRTAVDSRLLELETECAPQTRLCEPPVCEPVPLGCDARAACVAGRCVVAARSCDGWPNT